jgi:hypothetical protein
LSRLPVTSMLWCTLVNFGQLSLHFSLSSIWHKFLQSLGLQTIFFLPLGLLLFSPEPQSWDFFLFLCSLHS